MFREAPWLEDAEGEGQVREREKEAPQFVGWEVRVGAQAFVGRGWAALCVWLRQCECGEACVGAACGGHLWRSLEWVDVVEVPASSARRVRLSAKCLIRRQLLAAGTCRCGCGGGGDVAKCFTLFDNNVVRVYAKTPESWP